MRLLADILMRCSFGLIVKVCASLTAVPSHAQTFIPGFPVCMHVYSGSSGGGGEWYDCSFASLPQCRATATGRAATCDLNPYYPANVPLSRPRHGGSG